MKHGKKFSLILLLAALVIGVFPVSAQAANREYLIRISAGNKGTIPGCGKAPYSVTLPYGSNLPVPDAVPDDDRYYVKGIKESGKDSFMNGYYVTQDQDFIIVYGSTALDTGVPDLNALVATHGMAGMLNTIWIILCAMAFGAAMTATRMLDSIMQALLRLVRGTVSLVASTAFSGVFLNVVSADQYLSIILTATMFGDTYRNRGYESRLLSRTCEDSATVTSVLIPWNTCGMTQASVLGVSTLVYAPYCFFCYLSPIMTILAAALLPKKTLTR